AGNSRFKIRSVKNLFRFGRAAHSFPPREYIPNADGFPIHFAFFAKWVGRQCKVGFTKECPTASGVSSAPGRRHPSYWIRDRDAVTAARRLLPDAACSPAWPGALSFPETRW